MIYAIIIIAALGFVKSIASDFTASTKNAVTERHEVLRNL